MDNKQTILDFIVSKTDDYMALVKTMYENPEIGNQEFETMELLTNYLIDAGFETQKGMLYQPDLLEHMIQRRKVQLLPLCVNTMLYLKSDMDVVTT